MQSAKSGEGFVFDVRGPGRIWTQSRNPGEFVAWLRLPPAGRCGGVAMLPSAEHHCSAGGTVNLVACR